MISIDSWLIDDKRKHGAYKCTLLKSSRTEHELKLEEDNAKD